MFIDFTKAPDVVDVLWLLHQTCPDRRRVQVIATDCKLCFTTAWVLIPVGACENIASDLGQGDGFAGYYGFLHHLQLASRNMAIKVTKLKFQTSRTCMRFVGRGAT